jgi:hypothetical protein
MRFFSALLDSFRAQAQHGLRPRQQDLTMPELRPDSPKLSRKSLGAWKLGRRVVRAVASSVKMVKGPLFGRRRSGEGMVPQAQPDLAPTGPEQNVPELPDDVLRIIGEMLSQPKDKASFRQASKYASPPNVVLKNFARVLPYWSSTCLRLVRMRSSAFLDARGVGGNQCAFGAWTSWGTGVYSHSNV